MLERWKSKKELCLKVSSTIRPTYRVKRDPVSGVRELVQTGVEDFQELIDSAYSSSLDAILDRFLEDGLMPESISQSSFDQSFLEDSLDLAGAFIENMEEAREMYDFPSDWDYSRIHAELKNRLDNIMKGFQKNEKKKQENPPREAEVHQNGSEDA